MISPRMRSSIERNELNALFRRGKIRFIQTSSKMFPLRCVATGYTEIELICICGQNGKKNWSIAVNGTWIYFQMIFVEHGRRKHSFAAGDYLSTFLSCVPQNLRTLVYVFNVCQLCRRGNVYSTIYLWKQLWHENTVTHWNNLFELFIVVYHSLVHFLRISAPFCKFSSFLKKQ